METNPDLEFEYFLAEKLGRTVAEMRDTVSNAEFIGWSVYFGRKGQRQEMAAKTARSQRR
jgi:hypothetical protein